MSPSRIRLKSAARWRAASWAFVAAFAASAAYLLVAWA